MEKLLHPFSTLLFGVVLALILNIPMNFFECLLKKKNLIPRGQRIVSVFLSLLLIFGILIGIALWVIPSVVNAFSYISFPKELFQNIFGLTAVAEHLSKLVSSAAGICIKCFIALVFGIYILINKETLLSQVLYSLRVWLPESTAGYIVHIISVTTGTFRSFIVGQTLEAVILGSLCCFGMLLLKLPYALMTGTLVGVTALFPVIGAYAGAIAGVSLIYAQNPFQALIFLIFLVILQQIENNFIYPKVVGSKVNLPAIWVMASVIVGGSFGGPVGMFLAVPGAASAYALLKEATQKRMGL